MGSGRWLAVVAIAGAGIAVAAAVLLLRGDEGGEPSPPSALVARPTIVQDDAQVLHRSTAEVRRTTRALAGLGVDWLRVTANWSFIAPSPQDARRPSFDARDPAAYPPGAWAKLDRAVRESRSAGLRVMIDIAFWAPRWAVARPAPEPDRQRDGVDAREFGAFAEAVARRYRDGAVAYTIWNEPNYEVFLRPQWRRAGGRWEVASADSYRALVYEAVPGIRRHAPGALVLIGGTAALGTGSPATRNAQVPPLRFLRALACVDDELRPVREGACARFRPLPGDGWAHHPYSPRRAPDVGDPEPDTAVLADQGRLADLLDRLAAAGRTERRLGVWDTEFGYQTDPPDPTQPVTLAEQATLDARGRGDRPRRPPRALVRPVPLPRPARATGRHGERALERLAVGPRAARRHAQAADALVSLPARGAPGGAGRRLRVGACQARRTAASSEGDRGRPPAARRHDRARRDVCLRRPGCGRRHVSPGARTRRPLEPGRPPHSGPLMS